MNRNIINTTIDESFTCVDMDVVLVSYAANIEPQLLVNM